MGNRTENQGVFIGPYSSPSTSSTVASFNESTLPYGGALGQKYRVGDKWYQLVQVYASSTVAPADGLVAFWQDKDNYVVSATLADSHFNKVAGLFIGGITAGYYGFIQIQGFHTNAWLTPAAAANVTGLRCLADTGTSACVIALLATTSFPDRVPIGLFKDTSISGRATVEIMLRNG